MFSKDSSHVLFANHKGSYASIGVVVACGGGVFKFIFEKGFDIGNSRDADDGISKGIGFEDGTVFLAELS